MGGTLNIKNKGQTLERKGEIGESQKGDPHRWVKKENTPRDEYRDHELKGKGLMEW